MGEMEPTELRPPPATPRRAVAVALGALAFEAAVSALFARAGLGPLPLLLANTVVVAFAIVVLVDRGASIFDEVGMARSPLRGFAAGLAMAAPLALTLWLTRGGIELSQPLHLLRLALAGALADELFYRGFALRLLIRRARWGAPAAILATAIAVAAGRIGGIAGEAAPLDVAQAAGLGAATAAWFGWLFVAWDDDLWVPLALHFGLNLAWSAFDGAIVTGGGSPLSHLGRLASLAVSIAITLAVRRARKPKAEAEPEQRI
jgi:hypothetical protein